MLEFLYPKEYLMSVHEITAEKLQNLGIDTVIFDIDNTLVPYWIKTPTPKLNKFFIDLMQSGITVAVLSNSREIRSKVFCKDLGIPYVYRAKKPLTCGMKKLLKKLDKTPRQCMIAGDQIFTDVLCGNISGVYSVLIKQVSPIDEWITKPKRGIESLVVKMYLKKARKNK